VQQFLAIVKAPLKPVDIAYAEAHLKPGLRQLFCTMSPAEQHHGIKVCKALECKGIDDPELLTAALLHDAGKTLMPPHLWERVFVVLVEGAAPRLAQRWQNEAPQGLRRGFVIRRRHAAWGADLAAEAGAARRTVAWIRKHHDPAGEDAALAALQAADEARSANRGRVRRP
jgi:hypothetical protein